MMGLSGMVYNGENYYYEKNTLGDIIGIRNSLGQQVATYTYDAWGNILTKTGTMADINPFRYRGYYYDNETGFYYLQTRYYDPSIRLFINADNYELIGQLSCVLGQLNIYAYCNNNPIMLTDESGEFSSVLSLVIYVGACIVSIWDEEVRANMNDIGWNPFNTDADLAAGATKISFYMGSAVVSQDRIGTCAVFGTIWKNPSDNIDGIDIKHEFGHNLQERILGIFYWPWVVIPSVINYHIGDYKNYEKELSEKMYYSKIWERTADWLGGVNRNDYFDFWYINNFIFW